MCTQYFIFWKKYETDHKSYHQDFSLQLFQKCMEAVFICIADANVDWTVLYKIAENFKSAYGYIFMILSILLPKFGINIKKVWATI